MPIRYKFIFNLLITNILLSTVVFAQPLPSDTWLVRNWSLLLDMGYGWQTNTLFKPVRMEDLKRLTNSQLIIPKMWSNGDILAFNKEIIDQEKNKGDQLTGLAWIGYMGQVTDSDSEHQRKNFSSLYLLNQFRYRNFSTAWRFRAASAPDALEGFTPHPRPVKRLGMNCGELDQALIAYRNDWLIAQYGRGRQVWGTGLTDNLMLSSNSSAYDHFMAQFKYKRLTAIFFTGFLESLRDDQINQNRYIFGRGIQYSNHKNFIISFSEIGIYSGENRSFDFAYLNPLTPHIETELNLRENVANTSWDNSNAVWIASVDWMMPHRFRLSFSYLIDEFQFDEEDRKQGRPDATALQLRLSKAFVYNKSALIFYSFYNRVGTYTLRHSEPSVSFLSRGLPLGIPDGSDYYSIQTGFTWIAPFRLLVRAAYKYIKQGDNNLLDNYFIPYEKFIMTKFPSGKTKDQRSFSISVIYSYRPNLEFEINYQNLRNYHQIHKHSGHNIFCRLNTYLPVSFTY